MNKLLIICGPTATGKTSLALKLAKRFNGELVSADSRQVYKGMDIGTGKDLPVNAKFKYQNEELGGYYLFGGIKVWGYDLRKPNEEFSVADYIKIARKIIKNVWERNKLPILVGGTGFYIKGVVDGIDTAGVKKNKELREKLSGKSASELLEVLTGLDPVRAESLNQSDRENPRRLIRAIEIAKSSNASSSASLKKDLKTDVLFIGLKAPKDLLHKRIENRVESRIKSGVLEEVKSLFSEGVDWSMASMTATGYRQLKSYFKNKEELEKAIQKWVIAEKQYAKRQMTWFRKVKRIKWFDIAEGDYRERIEKLVKRWYFKGKDVSKKN